MEFDDLMFLIQTGSAAAAAASGNPLLAASLDGAVRLVKIGHDAYVSGRDRGAWSDAQVEHFEKVVLPTMFTQSHWQNRPGDAPAPAA